MKNVIRYMLLFFIPPLMAQTQMDSIGVRTSDGVELYVKTVGTGTPILFIHGGPGSTCLYFEKGTQGKLNSLGQWIFMDQRGSGRSGSSEEQNYQLERMITDFEEVRVHLGIQKWTLVAHSFGGIFATQYAAHYPNSIDRLVYLNATVSLPDSVNELVQFMEHHIADISTDDIQLMKDEHRPLTERFGKAFGLLNQKDRLWEMQFEHRENFLLDQKWMQQTPLNWDFAGKVFQHEEYLKSHVDLTKTIGCKVLVISGKKDRVIGPNHHQLIQAPRTTVHLSEGSHALYMERTEELRQVLSNFLRS